jgi:hypothetical protein
MRMLRGHEQEWINLLNVSDMLLDVCTLAIERSQEFSDIRGVRKVLLARKYHVEQWLREGFQELVQREEVFSDEEEELFGMEDRRQIVSSPRWLP